MIYLVSCGEKNKSIPVIIAASLWLVYRNCIGYTTWIRGIYPELPYSDVDILFGVILIFAVFCLMVKVVEVGKTVKRMASLLGPLSYTFYLLHADFGYFIRTQYYKRLVVVFPGLLSFVNEGMIMCTAIAASFALALIVHIAVNKINGLFKKKPPT